MTAPTNALRSGDGLRLLAPGERFSAGFSIAVVDCAEPHATHGSCHAPKPATSASASGGPHEPGA